MWLQQQVTHVCQEEEMSELWGSISILTFRHTVKSGYSKSCSPLAIGYLWIVFQFKIWLLEIVFWKLELRIEENVWMWELGCEESWALKNWCFWTVVLEKTLESHLDCKEIQPVHPKGLEGLMLKLKLQYFGHLMRRVDSLEKTLMLGGTGGRRRRGDRMR